MRSLTNYLLPLCVSMVCDSESLSLIIFIDSFLRTAEETFHRSQHSVVIVSVSVY